MKCLNCNAELTAQDKFCPQCGIPAPEEIIAPEEIVAPEETLLAADAAENEDIDISSFSQPIEVYCAYCGAKIEAGGKFCPDCGTPAGELAPRISLNQYAASAAPAPKKENNTLAVASYIIYAIAALSLLALLLIGIIFGFGFYFSGGSVARPNNQISILLPNANKLPAAAPNINGGSVIETDSNQPQTETSSQEIEARPSTADHQPIYDMNGENAQRLVDIFNSYSIFGTCPSDYKEMEYEEGKRFLMANGFSAEQAESCGVSIMTECHSIAQAEEHIRLYVTDALARSCSPNWRMEVGEELYRLIPGMGHPGYNYIEGSLVQEGNIWKAAFTMDYMDTITWATFVSENGMFKLSSLETDPSVTYPLDHPAYVSVTPQIAGDLVDIYNDYTLFGICPGYRSEVSEEKQEEIFENLGWGAENAAHYTIYKLEYCENISNMQQHVRAYIANDLFSAINPPVYNGTLGDFFCFEYDYGVYYATAHTGFVKIECDRTTLIYVGDNKWEAEIYSLDHGDSFRGKATFIIENGLAKVAAIEF